MLLAMLFKVWLVLILECVIASYSQEDNINICIKDGDPEGTTCQQPGAAVNYTFTNLSESVDLLNNYSDIGVLDLYMTRGTHYLNTYLDFNAIKVELKGSSSVESIIICTGASGIKFEGKYFIAENLTLVNCSKSITSIKNNLSITFNEARYYNGSMELLFSNSEGQLLLSINNCQFFSENMHTDIHQVSKSAINIHNSLFYGEGKRNNVTIEAADTCLNISVQVTGTNFMQSGIEMHDIQSILIENCLFTNYKSTGITIIHEKLLDDCLLQNVKALIMIINSIFERNARAIELMTEIQQIAIIKHCNFTEHYISTTENIKKSVIKIESLYALNNILFIRNSNFQGNDNKQRINGCYSISIENVQEVELENLTFIDNNCTGIVFHDSEVAIYNKVNLTRNAGIYGALVILGWSKLIMTPQSQLYMINNTAVLHGGGIYTDINYCGDECFFKISAIQVMFKTFIFSGNKANLGGNMVYGGCLSNCLMELDGKNEVVNVLDSGNIFWEFTSADSSSDSKFRSETRRVAFCGESYCSQQHSMNMNISIFRGEEFKFPLMAVDDYCVPSAKVYIIARAEQGEVLPDGSRLAKPICSNYSYSVLGNITKNFTINFYLEFNDPDESSIALTFAVKECPIGYRLNNGICSCNNPTYRILSAFNIRCIQRHYSLEIPALMWIGRKDGNEIAGFNCRYCHKENVEITLNDGDQLCTQNRTGILCGKCIEGYSLPLSGDKCTQCRKSTLQGTLLSILLLVIAVVLIIHLLLLNLTVSTGTINALIFYSNVIYFNSNEFLPINNNMYSELQNTVRFFSSFQAWMNLDIGLSVCFFEHYNAYISAWSQFAYPIYIWLLILLIVCASRYSRRLAKLTASNIVPVLATLLLLSYAKLLTVSINALSYTELHFIETNGKNTIKVWELDGHIHYLKGKHIPLFLMSILMTVAYIIPFTLLVLLGPLLQAKSHHRLLSWINKLKPLMDAFYGPFSNRYRYWPGILLLARVGLFITSALLHKDLALATVTVVVIALLILWSLISHNRISPYRNRYFNYLEHFFLFNLGCFSIMTGLISRNSKSLHPQQVLAVVMTGSAFIVFCGIIMYHIACALQKFKTVHNIYTLALHKIGEHFRRQKTTPTQEGDGAASQREVGEGCTHSTVAMTECAQGFELREPLLTK